MAPGTDAPPTTTWQPPTPQLAPRLWPAWQALLDVLADGEWHDRRELVDTMTTHSDILPKTASNLIASAARHGLIQRQKKAGQYQDRLTTIGRQHVDPMQVGR